MTLDSFYKHLPKALNANNFSDVVNISRMMQEHKDWVSSIYDFESFLCLAIRNYSALYDETIVRSVAAQLIYDCIQYSLNETANLNSFANLNSLSKN